jgi:hypothetical protein
MSSDFAGDGFFHPVVCLPDKQPLPQEPRWSRQPGCYQLKAALAFREAGDPELARNYASARDYALATEREFLPGDSDPDKVMDRLHAYCYFLEGLLAECDPDVIARGIHTVQELHRQIAPRFERSDVCAQLLRVRLMAHQQCLVPLDERAAADESARIVHYQRPDGGFWFGSREGELLPFVNPVSTAFCAQALSFWHGRAPLALEALI